MKLSELIFGKRQSWQSEADHEAGKWVAFAFYFILVVVLTVTLVIGWPAILFLFGIVP